MTRFLFPRWINKFLPLAAVMLLAGGGYAGALFMGATDPQTLNPGYMPDQPVPFSHKLHAGDLKMDCRYCHTNVDKAAHASVPATSTCINCHSGMAPDGGAPLLSAVHSDSEKLRAVRESWETDESIPWIRIHRLPDFVFFNHSAHVNRGVSCVTCHGRIDTMEKVYQAEELSMAWCIECHNNPAPHLRPQEFLTKLDWEPAEGEGTREEIGQKLIEENSIHPKTNCAVCHR
jgi:menaquinone reductase, multiheme cytochrome c subunit